MPRFIPLFVLILLVSMVLSSMAGPKEEMVPVQIKRVLLVNDSPAVLLVDQEEKSFLLVFIDFFMANSIRMGMQAPQLERPMTHDLMGIFIRQLGASIQRIEIYELKNNTYYALINLEVNGKVQQIDARPSDALALAVRNQTPIFARKNLLQNFDKRPKEQLENQTPTPEDPIDQVRPKKKKART